jgi:hypothetical protein
LQEQVEVVAQEAIMIKPESEALAVAGQKRLEIAQVVGIGENGLAVLAPVHDEIGGIVGQLHPARLSWDRGASQRIRYSLASISIMTRGYQKRPGFPRARRN